MGLFLPGGSGQLRVVDPPDAEFDLIDSIDTRSADHLTVTEAGELLDWLEGHGIRPCDVEIDRDGLFSVRWSD